MAKMATPKETVEFQAQLAAIRARLAAIAPRPWKIEENTHALWIASVPRPIGMRLVTAAVSRQTEFCREHAEFISHAPDDIEYLLDRLESAEDLVTELIDAAGGRE